MASSTQDTKHEAHRSAASMCAGSTVWIVLCAVGAILTAFAWLASFPIVFESSTLANAYDFHPIPQTITQSVFKVVSTQFAFWTVILCVVGGYVACLKPHKNRVRDLSRVRAVLIGIVCVFIVTFLVTLGTSHGYTSSIETREPEFATKFNDFYCETRTLDVCLKGDQLEDLLALVGDGTTTGSASSTASPSVPLASWLRCRNVMVENHAKATSRQRAFLANVNITTSADLWCGANFQNAKAATPSSNVSVDTPYELNQEIFSKFKREWPTRLLYDGLLLGVVLLFAIAHCWCLTALLRADGFEELVQDAKFAQSGGGMTPVTTV
ncbi:hypothetical protein FI667_g4911, partial [Globisporangium splendens]